MTKLYEAGFGLDVVHVDDAISAVSDDFVLRTVDGDAECLLARPELVDCVQAFLCQVVPESDHTGHVCATTVSVRPPTAETARVSQRHSRDL